jgi:Ni/Co efflux regulator RcnB
MRTFVLALSLSAVLALPVAASAAPQRAAGHKKAAATHVAKHAKAKHSARHGKAAQHAHNDRRYRSASRAQRS